MIAFAFLVVKLSLRTLRFFLCGLCVKPRDNDVKNAKRGCKQKIQDVTPSPLERAGVRSATGAQELSNPAHQSSKNSRLNNW